MTRRAAYSALRLALTLLVVVCNAFAQDEACESNNRLGPLVRLLGESEMKKIKGQMESVVLLSKLADSSTDCNAAISKQTEYVKTTEENTNKLHQQNHDLRLELKQIVMKVENAIKEAPVDPNIEKGIKMLNKLEIKLEKMEIDVESVKKLVRENADSIRRVECQKLIAHGDRKNVFTVEGMHLYFNLTSMSWSDARSFCESMRMSQARLKTLSQVEATRTGLNKFGLFSKKSGNNNFWVAATDEGHEAGNFYWDDNTRVDNSTWHAGDPDAFQDGRKTCVFVNTELSGLRDKNCWNTQANPLCEVPDDIYSCMK